MVEVDPHYKTLATILYYIREGYHGTALFYCEAKSAPSTDSEHEVACLKGVCYIMLGKSAEALRIFESLRTGPCNLAALYGLSFAHQMAVNPDKQSLTEIEIAINEEIKQAPDTGLLTAGEVLFLLGQPQKARVVMEKLIEFESNYPDTRKNPKLVSLLAWIDLALKKEQRSTRQQFELAADHGFPDGNIGMAKLCEIHKSSGELKVVTKDMTTQYMNFLPAHIERAKAGLVDLDWEATINALQNSSLASEIDNAYVAFLHALYAICAGGSKIDVALTELRNSLDGAEKDNHKLHYRMAAVMIRSCVRNKAVLSFAKHLLVRSLQLSRRDEYIVEELRLAIAMEDAKEATAIAKDLIQSGYEDPFALLGVAIAFLMNGKINEAAEQLDFAQSTYPNLESTPILHLVAAIVAKSKKNNFEEFKKRIMDALTVHKTSLQNIPFGVDYLLKFDADLLYTIALQLLDFAPIIPVKNPDETLKMTENVLKNIVDCCPGLCQVAYSLARVYYLKSETENAEQMIKLCLKKNETIAETYLLRAQMLIDKGQVAEADACLTTGLNFNFAVRDSSLYHLIKAKVFQRRGETERAVELLRSGLKIPQKESTINLLAKKEGTDTHRISIQLQLIDCLQTLKRTHEAESVMESAMEQWRGKPEEEKLILLNAQLQVAKGDPDSALAILNKVQPNQPNYQSARMKMAEIYLEEKKDKRMFTMCYRELMSSAQTPSNLTLLGDAYMSIQEPEKAIEVYERALKLSGSRDLALTEKIGEAYVNCHLFTKAVNFYESAMNANKDSKMRLKLADLLLKLGNAEKCERILRQPLNDDPSPIDPQVISAHVQYLQLLSKLHLENGKILEALEDLNSSKQLQLKLIQRNVSDSPANTQAKKEVAKIDCMMAELRVGRREMKEALELYNDALTFEPTNLKAVLDMANIHLMCNRLSKCQECCKQALVMDKHNEQAILMMADLLYLQNNVDGAMVHFVNLLEKCPNHYHALARYIELAWRNGHVEQVEKQLKRAQEFNPRAIVDSGYNYCRALHQWFSGETNSALQSFNRARKDSEWGEKSICNMIEICLNPDNEVLGGEGIDYEDGDQADREVGVKTAERFLNELRLKGQSSENKYHLMENFIMVCSRDRNRVQAALQNLLTMVGPDNDDALRKLKAPITGELEVVKQDTPVLSVGAVLGVARAYILQKNIQKAKQILKRVVNHPWSLEDADYLEKCWLLLADIYIHQNKADQAANILKTVLLKNKCSLKAYELMGFLNEKDGKFHEAAEYYETAWKLSSKNNPIVGYKLAYNFLKCRRLFECLEVCRLVLDRYPSYPRIKKEIMEKARMQLRS